MMTEREIKHEIAQILMDVLDNDSIEINRENTAADYPDWDSLTHIDFIVAIESQFKIKFSLEELKSFQTIGNIMDLVQRKSST
jgi:acyl carrier protein